MLRYLMLAILMAGPGLADTVVPTRTIRPNAIITDMDVTLSGASTENGFARISDVVGQEARVALYAGRPIFIDDIGPPAAVARNQLVQVRFASNGLTIVTEGRAMERGAVGDRVRVMNLESRATLFGQVMADGTVEVN